MNITTTLSIYVFSILTIGSYSPTLKACDSLDGLNWMVGDWQANTKKNIITEQWQPISAKTYEGVSKTFAKKDKKTTGVESMRLLSMGDELFYLAKVAHNELPVVFKLVECDAKSAIFENLNHDFPQRITYKMIQNNLVDVTVSDAKGKGFELNFVKQNSSPY